MNSLWQALTREAGLCAEHMAIGATAIGRANYAEHAFYGQAFFSLSIGLERSSKLALVVNHAIDHGGTFPKTEEIRRYRHGLRELLTAADRIAEAINTIPMQERLPQSPIHVAIIDILHDFASNITRYYNINVVTADPNVQRHSDPIRAWFERVTLPVLADHYRPHHRRRHERNARILDDLISGHSFVFYHNETGELLDTVYQTAMQLAITEFAKPFERLHVLQLVRFLARLLMKLGYEAQRHKLQNIPDFSDFFRIFANEDRYLKSRRTWSIYRS